MPPKKNKDGASKKAAKQKQVRKALTHAARRCCRPPLATTHRLPPPRYQEQLIMDRTFGLKNKAKSKQVQKYIKQVENNVKQASSKE